MKLADAAPIAIAGITVIGSLIQARRKRPLTREVVKQDLELLALLPEGSAARDQLQAHVDTTIKKIIEDEDQRTRDATGSCLAAGFLIISIVLLIVAFHRGGTWWWLSCPAAIIGLLGCAGLAQDAVPRRRDARGRPR
ncbi:hypothetical protein ABZ832_23255 [Streptantibioticus parmotrematis]|uniref:hypothetical protein n=1 Tax=Streptantibioticus parmotrematis TaxID=2873249 RepID=UPI003410100D